MEATRLSGAALTSCGADDALTRPRRRCPPRSASGGRSAPLPPLRACFRYGRADGSNRSAPAPGARIRRERPRKTHPPTPRRHTRDEHRLQKRRVFISSEPPAFPRATPRRPAERRPTEARKLSHRAALREPVPSRRARPPVCNNEGLLVDDSPLVESACDLLLPKSALCWPLCRTLRHRDGA